MAMLEFYLSDTDLDRIFAIKELQGKNNLTGNEFAAELLHNTLVNLFPATPKYDDNGQLINRDSYKGK